MTGPPREPVLDAWASQRGLSFAWETDTQITYTRSVGAWCVRTTKLSGREDWICVHPRADGRFELALIAGAGHVEVYEVDAVELAAKLTGVESWFRSWVRFMAGGPGEGH